MSKTNTDGATGWQTAGRELLDADGILMAKFDHYKTPHGVAEARAAMAAKAVNEHAALCRVAEALKDAEWLLRKLSVNWKEAGAMRDSAARSADDAREALQSLTTLRASVGGNP